MTETCLSRSPVVGTERRPSRIHPRLGELDEARVLGWFVQQVGKADENHRFVTETWRSRGTFRVERKAPRTTERGKMMPVHLGLGRTD